MRFISLNMLMNLTERLLYLHKVYVYAQQMICLRFTNHAFRGYKRLVYKRETIDLRGLNDAFIHNKLNISTFQIARKMSYFRPK